MHRFVVFAFLAIATGTAHAQFGNPYPTRITAVDAALDSYVNKQILDLAIERHNGKGSTKPKVAVKHEPLSASDFKPGKGRPAVDAFLAKAKFNFIDVKDLRPIIDRTFVVVEGQLRKNNVASALGFVVATSLSIARNMDLPEDALHELIASINDRLVTSPSFKKMKPADRQTMYDSLILTGAILITMNAFGEKDEGIKADAMEMANEVLVPLGK